MPTATFAWRRVGCLAVIYLLTTRFANEMTNKKWSSELMNISDDARHGVQPQACVADALCQHTAKSSATRRDPAFASVSIDESDAMILAAGETCPNRWRRFVEIGGANAKNRSCEQ